MKDVVLQPINERVSIETNARILDSLLAKECPVMMACGGQGVCATCHVYVGKGSESLTPMTEREKKTLSRLSGVKASSRLSCQCRIVGEGVEVVLPEGMYVKSFDELEALIGQRSNVPILHPIDGRVLIKEKKIITRSKIMELKDVDFDVQSVDSEKAK
ncbi:MAG: 2Fe-2S iron-sulfur cluster-binding protein [Verrucomicrobiota bacterium]